MQLRIVWAALLMSVLMFAGLAWFMAPQLNSPGLPPVAVWAMLGMAAFCVVASQLVARSPMMRGPHRARAIVSFALSESAGLTSGVAFMVSGATVCVGGLALAIVSLVSLYPRDEAGTETVKLMP